MAYTNDDLWVMANTDTIVAAAVHIVEGMIKTNAHRTRYARNQ
jgi:hypothetical protein